MTGPRPIGGVAGPLVILAVLAASCVAAGWALTNHLIDRLTGRTP